MARAWLSLGANIGEPAAQLAEAIGRIAAHPQITVVAEAPPVVTKPWGKTDQPDFVNSALEIETGLLPIELLEVLLGIEQAMGRRRIEVWGPRVIDIDIIAIERLEIDMPRLKVPHPHAHEREFVLAPLRQISPETANWIVSRRASPPAR